MSHLASADRYDQIPYRRCGKSGILLPEVSLGLWQNFGDGQPLDVQKAILFRAFDLGVTHFDLANNYGPPYGQAELNFGAIMPSDLRPYRDELLISTKAGWDMWPGPHVPPGLGRDQELIPVRPQVRGHDRAKVQLGLAIGRSVVVREIEVGHAQVEGPEQDGLLHVERLAITEVLPQPERHLRQQDAALPAAPVRDLVIAVSTGEMAHARQSLSAAGGAAAPGAASGWL